MPLGLLALLIAAGVACTDFTYAATDLNPAFLCLAIFAATGVGARWLGFGRLGGAIEAFSLFLAIDLLGVFASVMLAATAAPLADAALIHADAALFGFSWRNMTASLAHQDAVVTVMARAYGSLHSQPGPLIAVLFFLGKSRRGWTFMLGWTLTLFLCLAVFPFFPAVGGFVHYGFLPADLPLIATPSSWGFTQVFDAARNGTLREIGLLCMAGIITFPSFHAAGAVVLGWAWWGVPVLRWPIVVVNALMVASAVIVGGHYLVDVVAGGLIAAIAITGSIHIVRRISSGSGHLGEAAS